MGKSVQPLARPERANFSSEDDYYRAYGEYMESFDTSPVEDFSDLNIQFYAYGYNAVYESAADEAEAVRVPIRTPSMSNFTEDLREIIREYIDEECIVNEDSYIEIYLNEGEEPVGGNYRYSGEYMMDIVIGWTTHEEDYERVLPDGNPVKSFSSDYYDMEKFQNLERLARERAGEKEFAAGIDSIPGPDGPDKGDGLGQ